MKLNIKIYNDNSYDYYLGNMFICNCWLNPISDNQEFILKFIRFPSFPQGGDVKEKRRPDIRDDQNMVISIPFDTLDLVTEYVLYQIVKDTTIEVVKEGTMRIVI